MIVCGDVVCDWVAQGIRARWAPGDTAIGWMSANGELQTGMLYSDYTGASICLTARVTNPKAVTRKWLHAIFDYPFNQLGVKRLTCLISSGNTRSIRASEHLGWKRETTLKDYFLDGDGLVYVMRRDDCRWLDCAPQIQQRQLQCASDILTSSSQKPASAPLLAA